MPPRGTRDILPAESRLRRRIVGVAQDVFAAYGYGQITTPTFEHTEVFARGVGASTDIVRKEMYTFTDGGGESLTLRPEGTAAVARAFIEHGMHKEQLPVKLWYHLPMFRYERPQAGRYREHTQLGAEAIGSEDPLLDVEVISLLADIYRRLEVPGLRLKLGSMGDAESRGPYRARLVEYVERYAGDLDQDARERLALNPLRLFDTKDERVRRVMEEAPKLIDNLSPAAQAHRDAVNEGLAALGIDFTEDGTLVRGFDYYTKTVFEFSCDKLGAQSGIGGGGRYDGLVAELGGPDVPGIGWGSGVDRIALALAEEKGIGDGRTIDVYLALPDAGLRVEGLRIARDLRAAGLTVDSDMRGDRGMKALMRHASALGARVTVIVGPREWEARVASVRDMATGEQREVALDGLASAAAEVLA